MTMGAAKDAFSQDHPELFYVDYDYISLRVTQKEDGTLNATLGTGRGDNYTNKSFVKEDGIIDVDKIQEGIQKVNAAVAEYVEGAEAITEVKENQNIEEQRIKYVHDKLINSVDYTYEYETSEANAYNVRNVYGAFVNKQIVCEGYARAFKMVLDKLGIPCVLVMGVYRHTENVVEPHMWNYVQLENGTWYALDATFDDPSTGTENSEYFLVGDDKLAQKHIPTGIISNSNYEFTYPTISNTSDKFEVVFNSNGLKVEMDDESIDEQDGAEAAKFKISYNGMNYTEAAKKGYYLIAQYFQGTTLSTTGETVWNNPKWGYLRPDIWQAFEEVNSTESTEGYLKIALSNCEYIQVGVTDIAPKPYTADIHGIEDVIAQTTYLGSPTSILVQTNKIFNANAEGYDAPPYVKTSTPVQNSTLYIGSTYHMKIVYNDVLIKKDENEPVTLSILTTNNDYSSIEEKGEYIPVNENSYKVENFTYYTTEGDDTDYGTTVFEFEFTPSEMFADDSIFYDMRFNNLKALHGGKEPNPSSYFCAHRCAAYAFKSQGYDWNVFGKPQLMEDVNLSMDDWKEAGSNQTLSEEFGDIGKSLTDRLVLVTTKTTEAEDKAMKDAIDKAIQDEGNDDLTEEDDKIIETETYNIDLTLCKKQIIYTGQGVRVCLGFPAGYGPEDEGVTFKAYHFTRNAHGDITGVEEIDCVVTELGLIVTCKSFSPFTIAVVEKSEEAQANTDKTVVVQTSNGGTANINGNMQETFTSGDGAAKTLTINANEGYEIDEVVVGKEIVKIPEENKTSMTVSLVYGNKQDNQIELPEGNSIVKVAFATVGTHKEEKEAGVTVVEQPIVAEPSITTSMTSSKEIAHEKEEFEVTVNAETFTNIGEGIDKISGEIQYDKNSLTLESVTGKEATQKQVGQDQTVQIPALVGQKGEETETGTKFEFTAQDGKISIPTELFKIKFKVKEGAKVGEPTSIKLANMSADKNAALEDDLPVNVEPSQIGVSIEQPISSNSLNVESVEDGNDLITNIETSTTVAVLKGLINVSLDDKTIEISKNGRTLSDAELVGTGAELSVTNSVGEKLTYVLVVTGDLDGDGKTSSNDIAAVTIYLARKNNLSGITFKAALLDNDSQITSNDLAAMILITRKSH